MPLTWSLDKCKDKEVLESDEMWPATWAVIYTSMATGISEVTKRNVKELWIRYEMYALSGAPLISVPEKDGKRQQIKLSDLKRFIGLTTNVNNKTRSKLHKDLIRQLRSQAERNLAKQLNEER